MWDVIPCQRVKEGAATGSTVYGDQPPGNAVVVHEWHDFPVEQVQDDPDSDEVVHVLCWAVVLLRGDCVLITQVPSWPSVQTTFHCPRLVIS